MNSIKRQIWMPVWFCATIVAISFAFGSGKIDAGTTVVWFPACFLGVAMVQVRLLRRIEALEAGHAAPRAANRSSPMTK